VFYQLYTHTHTDRDRERKEDKTRGLRIDPADGWIRNSPFGRTASRWTSARAKNFWFAHHSLPLCHIILYMAHTHTYWRVVKEGCPWIIICLAGHSRLITRWLQIKAVPPSLSVSAHLDSRNNGKAIRQLSLIVENEQFWPIPRLLPTHFINAKFNEILGTLLLLTTFGTGRGGMEDSVQASNTNTRSRCPPLSFSL
jgi:hypothetical protein